MPDERCYFGCEADAFHTLLYIPPPFNRTPRLCAVHSKGWRSYKSSLKKDTRWPEDFWSWADKELEIMKQQVKREEKRCYLGHAGPVVLGVGVQTGDGEAALCGPCAESWSSFAGGRAIVTDEDYRIAFARWLSNARANDAIVNTPSSITASEAVLGQWYVVPSGEIEKACALRGGDSGPTQVGFLHAGGNPNDPDDIRWLPASMEVTPASAEEVRRWEEHVRAGPVADCEDRAIMPSALAQAVGRSPGWIADPSRSMARSHEIPETPAAEDSTAPAPEHKLSPLFSSESGEWQTDPDDFAWLNDWAKARWGSGFVLDVCASKENALCNAYFTKERSCLDEPLWFGPWYMNPPYGDPEHPCKVPHERCKKKTCEKRGAHVDVYIPGIGDFVNAARCQAQAGHPGMCLLPYRPDTEWWREGVLAPDGEQVAMGGDWAQGWSWVRWSSGLLVETRLISGRLSFVRPGGGESWTAPFPSVVVVFDRWK